MKYLFPHDFMADPSAHVFDNRLYIYPSHDRDAGVVQDDDGSHFDMRDYHVLSLDDVEIGLVTDHGNVLDLNNIAWASRQLWDNDVVEQDGRYYMVFCAKDQCGIFRLGVATSDRPEGPFIPQADPIRGSYSIDPCLFKDNDGSIYCYFGGIWGGQLQWYHDNVMQERDYLPKGTERPIPSRVVRMTGDMLQFAEAPRPVLIIDAQISRTILFQLLHRRQPSAVLCRGRQPIRPLHIPWRAVEARRGMDHPPQHLRVSRTLVSLPSRQCTVGRHHLAPQSQGGGNRL